MDFYAGFSSSGCVVKSVNGRKKVGGGRDDVQRIDGE